MGGVYHEPPLAYTLPKESLREAAEVPVEHAAGITALVSRPMVLHQLIRLQDVRADLVPEGGLGAAAAARPPFLLEALQAGDEQLHRGSLVLNLGPLALALHHDPRWPVPDPDGRRHLVHVLSARAARAEGLRLQVRLVDGHCRLRRSEERRVGKECRSRWSPY